MGGMRCKVCQKGSKNAIIFACGVAEIKSHLLIFHKDVHQLVCRTNQLDDSNNETPAKVPCPNAEQSRTVKQLTCCSSRSSRKLKRKHSNLSQDYNTCQTTTPSRPYNLRSQSAKRLNCSREESCSMQQVPVDQCYVAPDVVVNSTSRKPSASTRNKTPVKNLKETVKNLTQSSRANCSNSVCSTATHRSKQKINCLPISQLDYDWIQVADCELESDIHLLLKAHDMVKIDNQRECHSNLARPTFYNCLFEKTKGCRFQISQLVPYSKPKKKLPRLDLEIVEDEIAPSAATSTTTCLTHLKSSINSSAAAARHPTRTAIGESGTTDATPPEIYKRRTNTNYTLLATFDNPQEFKSYRERKSKGLNLWSLKNNDKLANGCTRTRFRCYSYRFTKCRCCLVAATAPNTDTIWVYRNSADHNHMVDNGLGVDISSTSHGATTSATDPIVTYNQLISVPAQFVSQHIKMPIPGFDLMDETLSQRIQNLAEDLILKLDIVGTNFYFYHGFNPEACVALEDFYLGGVVMVQTREHNGVVSEERWIKGDFDQFLCAVRGKCMEVFFQTERRERHTPDSEDTPMPVIEIGDEEEESDTQEGPFTLTNGTRNEVFSMAAYNMLLQFANLDRGIQFLRDQQIQFPAEELQFLDEPSNSVQVIHIVDGMIASVKRWVKADWSQFVCAVRGICFNHFYASPLESMKREMKLESENQSTEVE
uniref:Uncharacterized protein n=1 Tax=Ditylenchus dipsaci TaxID=166011 RepID=A0A915EP22_9BILA